VLVPTAVLIFAAAGTHSAAAATPGACSKTTAARVARQAHVGVDPFTHKSPIAQAVCGPLFGPGSRGMALSIAIPSCGFSIEWAVFRSTNGSWRKVLDRPNGAALSLADGGAGLRETQGVLHGSDTHCAPSRIRARVWRFAGGRFTPSPWKTSPAKVTAQSFRSQDGDTWCHVAGTVLTCVQAGGGHTISLGADDTITRCDTGACTTDWDPGAPLVADLQTARWSGFSCTMFDAALRCSNADVKTFTIGPAGITVL
jgi:hypothetical protein